MERSDILIVGAGPAGLSAGIYAGRSQLRTLVLEMASPGGWAATTDRIENYPGVSVMSGADLMARMVEQAQRFGAVIEQGTVGRIEVGKDGFTVRGQEGMSWDARAVIVATGTGFRKLGVPGEDELLGRGVSYCATCDGPLYKGLEIAVVGGGNSALQEALLLTRFAARVHLIHRRDEFRAERVLAGRVRAHPQIACHCRHVVLRVNGVAAVESVGVRNTDTGVERDIPVAGVFFFIGKEPKTAFVDGLVERDEAGFIRTDDAMRTSRRGVLAAGDCRAKILRQVATAVSDGATAAFMAQRYVEEDTW